MTLCLKSRLRLEQAGGLRSRTTSWSWGKEAACCCCNPYNRYIGSLVVPVGWRGERCLALAKEIIRMR